VPARFVRSAIAQPSRSAWTIVIEAEFGHRTSTSAQAIEMGTRLAAEEFNASRPPGAPALVVRRSDNAGLPALAVDNLREIADDPDVLTFFGGKFSPVVVEMLPVAHELGVLLCSPWGSADEITDHGRTPSWSFRLSLKDAWAAPALLRFAQERKGASRVGLLLPTTSWGRSNSLALERAAASYGPRLVGTRWFSWGERSLVSRYRELTAAGADAVIFVTNELEGAVLTREVAALVPTARRPLICHWGITGGRFPELVGDGLRTVDLSVIQTFSFVGNTRPAAQALLRKIQTHLPGTTPEAVPSAVGIAHAYDLTHLVGRAILAASEQSRAGVRNALERLGPYSGVVRDYPEPFSSTRHDALSADDVLFARYDTAGQLIPLT
jgi:branched-chain amino acid transport system substrate-binding protein